MPASNAVIGALRVNLGMDSAEFEAGIKRAQLQLGNFGKINIGKGVSSAINDLTAGFQDAAKSSGVLGAALSAIGPAGVVAGAALAAAAAAAVQARHAFALADDIGDTAAKLGVTTRALQEYRYAVHALGGDFDDADKAFQGFSEAYGLAVAKYSAKSIKPFTALGLDPKTLGTTDEALHTVIDRISKLGSSSAQAAAAAKLGLTPMLAAIREGPKAFDDARDAAERLGFVMGDDLVQKGGAANDALEAVQKRIDVQLSSAFIDLAPAIVAVAEGFADAAHDANLLLGKLGEISDWAKAHGADLGAVIAQTFRNVVPGGGAILDLNEALNRGKGASDKTAKGPVTRADMAAFLPPQPAGQFGDGSADAKIANASQQAIDTAQKAELAAQIGLTKNIQALADLRVKQVVAETAAENGRLQREAAEGSITKAAAATAIASNKRASSYQIQAILSQREDDLAQAALDQREAVARFVDRQTSAEASMAATAQERGEIEAGALENAQDRERETLKADNAKKVRDKQISQAEADYLVEVQAAAQSAERTATAQKQRYDVIHELAQLSQSEIQLRLDVLQAAGSSAQSDYARSIITLRILDLEEQLEKAKLQEVLDTTAAGSAEHKIAQARLDMLDTVYGEQKAAIESANRLDNALAEAADDVANAFADFKRGDLSSAFGALSRAMTGLAGILGQSAGGLLSRLSGTLGTIGTTAAAAQTLGLGTGKGGVDLGLSGVGFLAGKALLTAPLSGIGGGIASSLFGSVAGGAATQLLGAAAGPIGMLAALAIGTAFKEKESNHAAIATFNGDYYTVGGDKRNDQTSQLATSTADTILQAQKALEAAGVKFSTTISAVDIGTRDAAHVILSTGQKIEAGVGDAAGAAEAGLKAMLEGATYANAAQESLVKSMLAAGAGFDAVADALGLFNSQAQLPSQIASAIQQILDPRAYDVAQLKATQADRRAQVEAAIAAGAVGADQADSVRAQLTKLEGLELDQALKKYADAATDGASAVKDAQDDLKSAFNDTADTLRDQKKTFTDLGASLRGFAAGLGLGAQSALNPLQQTAAARAALASLETQIPNGDPAVLGKLQDAASSFLSASKATAPNAEAYAKDVAWVRKLLESAATVADHQASLAQQQLDQLTATVAALGVVNESVLTVAQAIDRVQAALAANTASNDNNAGTSASAASAAASLSTTAPDVSASDLAKVQSLFTDLQDPTSPVYGQRDAVAAALLDGYRAGQFDPDSGTYQILKRAGFATGGGYKVGGSGGIDSQLQQFWATPGEHVSVSHVDPYAGMAGLRDEIAKLRAEVKPALESIAVSSASSAKVQKSWEGIGLPPTRAA